MVITGAPRKRLACQKRARGFESHPLRQLSFHLITAKTESQRAIACKRARMSVELTRHGPNTGSAGYSANVTRAATYGLRRTPKARLPASCSNRCMRAAVAVLRGFFPWAWCRPTRSHSRSAPPTLPTTTKSDHSRPCPLKRSPAPWYKRRHGPDDPQVQAVANGPSEPPQKTTEAKPQAVFYNPNFFAISCRAASGFDVTMKNDVTPLSP